MGCRNDNAQYEEGEFQIQNKRKTQNTIQPPKPHSKTEYIELIEDQKTLQLKTKIKKHLMASIGAKYQKVFDRYEDSLLSEGLMPSRDGKGFLAFIQKCKESGSLNYMSPAKINMSSSGNKMDLRVLSTRLQQFHEQMGHLPRNSPLWFFFRLTLDLKNVKNMGPDSFLDPILHKMDAQMLDDPFYRSFTILFILNGVS